jgi:membrane protein YdbS with pleckstrin-like domain
MEARGIPLNTPIKPDQTLLKYYFTYSLLWLFLFPFIFIAKYIRYRTLRYVFTDKEVTMSWGGIQKQSISVSYERVQDIQLSSGPIERQYSLAKVQLQTASGDASAEIVLEGFLNPAELRDQLYEKIQSAKNPGHDKQVHSHAVANEVSSSPELVEVLKHIAGELKAIRKTLASKQEYE